VVNYTHKVKKTLKFLEKWSIQILLTIVIILLLANLISKQGFVIGFSLSKPTPTPVTTTIPTPTLTPALTPTPSLKPTPKIIYIRPTAAPSATPNPAIQDRIKQIDQQLANNQIDEQKLIDTIGKFQHCGTTTCVADLNGLNMYLQNLLSQDQQLKAEKAQLQIQQH
jgi:hypothetical protein